MPTRISRRALLTRLGATSLLAASPAIIEAAPAFLRGQRGDPSPSDLFSLGVGSGNPESRSVVLWTRLAPDPLEGGGMTERTEAVRFRVALDPGMTQIIRAGTAQAFAAAGHSVHVTLSQLEPNRWYWYQFEVKGVRSRIGRTRTFPAWYQNVEQLRFALVSCQNYTDGYVAAYRDMLDQRLDFVLHVGDYIYESGAAATPLLSGRNHTGEEIFTLDDYRNRYALYRLDSQLQDVHATLPFLCTWDDHEVDNNYAGKIAEETAPYQGKEFLVRRANAYQVYGESMALDQRPSWNTSRFCKSRPASMSPGLASAARSE
jgi:alkaline phosphatase D